MVSTALCTQSSDIVIMQTSSQPHLSPFCHFLIYFAQLILFLFDFFFFFSQQEKCKIQISKFCLIKMHMGALTQFFHSPNGTNLALHIINVAL